MRRRAFLKRLCLAAGATLATGYASAMGGCAPPGTAPLENLVLQAPPSPPSLALAKLVEDRAFEGQVRSAQFMLWKNPDEMRGRITSGQAQISGLPVNVAATLYNKGLSVQLTNVYIWGILYLVSSDPGVRSWEDLAGEEVLIPFRGDLPDIVTQLLLEYRGLELGEDLRVRYVAAAPEAAGLLAAGQAKHAVLSEPSATVAFLRATETGIELHRAIDLQADWAAVTGQPPRLPMAGVTVLPELAREHGEIVQRLQAEQAEAVRWVRENPQQAAELGRSYVPDMPAPAMAASLPHIALEFVSAADARSEIEFLFDQLARLSPALYGGKLPGDDFYYAAPQG